MYQQTLLYGKEVLHVSKYFLWDELHQDHNTHNGSRLLTGLNRVQNYDRYCIFLKLSYRFPAWLLARETFINAGNQALQLNIRIPVNKFCDWKKTVEKKIRWSKWCFQRFQDHVDFIVLFGDFWPSQLRVCAHHWKKGPQRLRASPSLSLKLLWEAVYKDPTHMNVESILQNFKKTTRNFSHAFPSVGHSVRLVGESFNVVKDLDFVFPNHVVSVQ